MVREETNFKSKILGDLLQSVFRSTIILRRMLMADTSSFLFLISEVCPCSNLFDIILLKIQCAKKTKQNDYMGASAKISKLESYQWGSSAILPIMSVSHKLISIPQSINLSLCSFTQNSRPNTATYEVYPIAQEKQQSQTPKQNRIHLFYVQFESINKINRIIRCYIFSYHFLVLIIYQIELSQMLKSIFAILNDLFYSQYNFQMQKQKGHRVNFRIIHCSSEDPQYPVRELLLQSPNSKGWQSKRFCQYPQTIVYELVEPTLVKQITIFSHQSKIATKIIIHKKLDVNKEWSKVGHFSLQSNVNCNYQSRQFKKLLLKDVPTLQLRFTIEANYQNNHNMFNQVGIISLCVIGDRMVSQDEAESNTMGQNNRVGSSGGLNIDKLDKGTIAKLKDLQVKKKIAIDKQDFDEAQSIKQQIQRLKKIGNTLIALEEKKKEAVANQDYETAKIINNKIKQLRDQSGGGPNFSMRPSGTPTDYFRQKKTVQQEDEPSVSPMTHNQMESRQRPVQQVQQMKKRSPPKKMEPDDERPIHVKNTNPYQTAEDNGRFPGGQDNDQPGDVSPLTKQIRAECQGLFHILDEQIFMHLFSSHHMHRDRGINMVKDQIMSGQHDKNSMTEAFLYVVRKMIDDKNAAVLASTLDLFNIGMKKLRPAPGHYNQTAQEILEKINDYLGHTNEKIKRTAEQIYHNLPQYQLTNKDFCYRALTVIGKRDKPPKILTGRLKMIDAIVGSYQLGKNYENVINFAVKYADDKNSEVRNSAIALICTISAEIGYGSMLPFLKSLRPQILKSIEEKVQSGDADDRNFDEKPIPTHNNKKAQQLPIKNQKLQEFQAAENQFIDVPPPKNVTNPDYTCEFCLRFDKRFENDDYRDLHLFNACPMLTICEQCKQAIEINTLTAHRLSECPNSKYYKKCPRCKEAVHQRIYKAHVEKKECIPAKGLAVANRCPLCHLDIDPGQDGWVQHLVEEGCENSPRK